MASMSDQVRRLAEMDEAEMDAKLSEYLPPAVLFVAALMAGEDQMVGQMLGMFTEPADMVLFVLSVSGILLSVFEHMTVKDLSALGRIFLSVPPVSMQP